jgi:hypothetical protein
MGNRHQPPATKQGVGVSMGDLQTTVYLTVMLSGFESTGGSWGMWA